MSWVRGAIRAIRMGGPPPEQLERGLLKAIDSANRLHEVLEPTQRSKQRRLMTRHTFGTDSGGGRIGEHGSKV